MKVFLGRILVCSLGSGTTEGSTGVVELPEEFEESAAAFAASNAALAALA